MTLQEIFTQLAHGELSQLISGDDAAGTVPVDRQAQVLGHINLGLTELHKRFFLREGRLTLQTLLGRNSYPLHSRYAESGYALGDVYILDSVQPFQDDLMRIERVYDADGTELSVDVEADREGVLTTALDTLWVPHSRLGETLTVEYRANHPTLVYEDGFFYPEEIEVALPWSHLQALLLFVASRMFNPFGGAMEGGLHEGNNYHAKFERACQELQRHNLTLTREHEDTKFERRGFV